jgi:hypothetical protein
MLGSAAAPQEKKTGPLLLRGCTVFDIGQNYHHIIHDASIYSFETQSINCEMLKNVDANIPNLRTTKRLLLIQPNNNR